MTELHAWAETIPWTCLIRETNCISKTHDHSPMVGDPCAICTEPFKENQRCFAVTEMEDAGHHPQWVCEKHITVERNIMTDNTAVSTQHTPNCDCWTTPDNLRCNLHRAAPELLSALEDILNCTDGVGCRLTPAHAQKARIAIEKARRAS